MSDNIIGSETQRFVEQYLQLQYEYVFDFKKAWRIFWGVAFLAIPFRLVIAEPLSTWGSLALITSLFFFMRMLLGDPIRKQLTLESVERLNDYLYREMSSGDSDGDSTSLSA